MPSTLRITAAAALLFTGSVINAAVFLDASAFNPFRSAEGKSLAAAAALTLPAETPAPPAPSRRFTPTPAPVATLDRDLAIDRKLLELTIRPFTFDGPVDHNPSPRPRDSLTDHLTRNPLPAPRAGAISLPDAQPGHDATITPVVAIPEPSTLALLTLATLIATYRPPRTP